MNTQTNELKKVSGNGKLLTSALGSCVEAIAAARARGMIADEERQSVIDGLRMLGRCAYQLAEDLEGGK